MPSCVTIDATNILRCVYTQNSLKRKQNKVDYTIMRMLHNVTIRYRYKLFAHKLALVGNLLPNIATAKGKG